MATSLLVTPCMPVSQLTASWTQERPEKIHCLRSISLKYHLASSSISYLYSSGFCGHSYPVQTSKISDDVRQSASHCVVACLSSSASNSDPITSTKLYISGLSFRTTEESLRNAFEKFGQLVEVNLVMDKIANRPRGFAFVSYATGDQSKKAIEGMHGKFLDGRVIFVEVAKPISEARKNMQNFREPQK